VRRLVALAMPGGPGFVEELERAWDAGDAVLPVDLRLALPARRRLLEAMRPAVLVTAGSRGKPGLEAHRSDREAEALADPLPVEEGDALVMPTSGTTGEPKGVVLTQSAVAASAAATSRRIGVDPGTDAWWACLPLAHVGGLSVVTRSLLEGVPCEVVEGFSVEGAAAALGRGATLTSLVPTTLRRLGDGLADRFRRIVLGGAAPPGGLAPNVVTTYGMTETGSGVVYDGWPLDGVEVRVEGGEVHLRGPMLLRSYRDGIDPKDAAGWLHTGDAGELDGDGRLVVFGRLVELIITGGENVWPSAVETLLRRHVQVADAAVAGVPDPEWGERVVAYVVLAGAAGSGGDGTAGREAGGGGEPPALLGELRELVSSELAGFAAPRELIVVPAIPRTALGKVRRSELVTLEGRAASI
jgi:O-succinylbenzoic acid--CoA ligase